MNVHLAVGCDAVGNESENGIGRFFSPTNLGRYRRLAGDRIDAIERNRILKLLAEEWGAFARGCRIPSASQIRSFPEGLASRKSGFKMTRGTNEALDRAQRSCLLERPPIVLTASDRDRLIALLRTASTMIDPEVARFLREELERADIVREEASPTAVVSIGSIVKFIDHKAMSIRQVKLVHPHEANDVDLVSVTGGLGSALIGLGPRPNYKLVPESNQTTDHSIRNK